MASNAYYIGLMSGTSADGIDLALVEFDQHDNAILVASYFQAYDDNMHCKIISLYEQANNEIDRAFCLDVELAKLFAGCINQFLKKHNLTPQDICAIGSHGQTIRHRPETSTIISHAFTLQIGCIQTLAVQSGIRVIGDFRRKDIALGGQGAPLVPAFHQAIFRNLTKDVFVVNIGGIANITYLPHQKSITTIGFDTGPGNALMDFWYQAHHQGSRYDESGNWAATGIINDALLQQFLADEYFSLPAPKSTGREYFNSHWLQQFSLEKYTNAEHVQATLAALTATSIAREINKLSSNADIYVCGGGLQNKHLNSLLNQKLNKHRILNTQSKGIDSDSLEAMAFAWLAYAFDKKIPGNIPAVTGATKETVLGIQADP